MTTATLGLSYRAVSHKIKNRVLSLHFIKINWKVVYFLAFLALVSMIVFYILMVNQLTKGAYLIKNYNKDVTALLKENKILEASFAESGFLGGVQEKAKELSFHKTTGVTYINILQNSLAEAK